MPGEQPGRRSPAEAVASYFLRYPAVPGDVLVVAVSGGQDSVCLLHVLASLRQELGMRLHVAHLDHGLRPESGADAEYVDALARRLGLPATIARRNVCEHRRGGGLSLEAAAREVRYGFLAEVAGSSGASAVAVGHTRDDHAETVLLHLIRGAGTTGLRGLLPVSRLCIGGRSMAVLRPLLEVGRDATAAYCASHRLEPREDASNFSMSALRNRIRHRLLPQLRQYNPRIADALVRTADIVGEDSRWLDAEAERVSEGIVTRQGHAVLLDKAGLLALPLALQRNLLRLAVGELTADLRGIEWRHVEDMLAALDLPAGRRICLPGGLLLAVEYHRYVISRDPAVLCPFPELVGETELAVPGFSLLPGWQVEAALAEPAAPPGGDPLTAYLDPGKLSAPLTVRSRRAGDRFRPLGMDRPKKVGRFMIDAHVPRAWRERVPVVCSGDGIIWVVGYRVDESFRVTDATRKALRLTFQPVP